MGPSWPPWQLAVTAATRAAFEGVPPFILFVLPVLAAAVCGGWKPGLVTTIVCAVLATGLFVEFSTQSLPATGDLARIVLFTIVGAAVTGLADAFLTTRRLSDKQRDLLAAAETYRGIVEEGAALICRYRPDGTLTFVNEAYCRCFGRSRTELVGHTFAPLVPDEDRPAIDKLLQALRPDMDPYTLEHRVTVADGSVRWQRWTNRAIHDAVGRFVEYQGLGLDITDRREAEAALQASEERHRQLNITLEQRVAERTAELADSERRFRAIFHSQFQFIGLMATDGTLLEANRTALVAAGVDETAVIGKPFWDTVWWTHDPAQQDRLKQAVVQAAGGRQDRFEANHPTADGGTVWVDFSLTPYRDAAGRVVLLIPEGRDITDHNRVEAALRLSEERFRGSFEHAAIGKALVGPDGRWLQVNRALCDLLGYTEAELLVTDFQAITHPADLDADLLLLGEMLAGTRQTYQMEKRYFHKHGHLVHVLLSVSLVRDDAGRPVHFISQIQDITARKQAEEQTRASLREKEVMLKEIHHRVKNNLQIVSTLLDLQSGQTADPAVLAMFKESRGRVRSMALIHERLYRSADMARVEFAQYIRQLADDLYRAYKLSDADIRLELAVDAPPLPIDIAIPCGLLLNELVSNCLKHAFTASGTGTIRVSLCRQGEGELELIVADDGAGFPPDTDFRDTPSFGLQLVNTLVEQLNGAISLTNGRGSTFRVQFPTITR